MDLTGELHTSATVYWWVIKARASVWPVFARVIGHTLRQDPGMVFER